MTGASSGIGLAVVRGFVADGWRVAMLARDPHRLAAAAASLRGAGTEVLPISTDVATGDVAASFAEIAARSGPIDVLVTCAGMVPPSATIEDLTDEDWDRAIAVNLTGAMRCCRAAWPHLAAGARIVTVGSVVGPVVGSGLGAYAASKGGLAAFTRVLAAEGAARGIRVNTVTPGFIETPMTTGLQAAAEDPQGWWEANLERIPLGRAGTPEEVAAAIRYLVSDEAAFVVGTDLRLDGGLSLGARRPPPSS